MNLSIEIQKELDELKSNVKLASTIYGDLPDKYAFHKSNGRSFRVQFADNNYTFSIVLFEKIQNLNYEYCYARAIINDINRLAKIIKLWVEKEQDINDIKDRFYELDLFVDFDFRNPNIDIDNAWTKIRNIFFNDTKFWQETEWRNRYSDLLTEAKRHKYFENYFPFTSHYWIRFSPTKVIQTINLMDYFIVASFDKTKGNYCVSVACELQNAIYFKTAKECLDFVYETYYKEKN